MFTWSRQGRVAQQKAIIKEVKRHVQLNHQSDSNTIDNTEGGKTDRNGRSENLVLQNERQKHLNHHFQPF